MANTTLIVSTDPVWDSSSYGCPNEGPYVDKLASLFTYQNSFSGVENPNWRQQIKGGLDATTPATGRLFKFTSYKQGYVAVTFARNESVRGSCNSGNQHTKSASGWGQFTSNYDEPANNVLSSVAVTKAKEKFVKSAKKYITPLQGGVALGELRETLRMIRNPAIGLRRLVDNYFGVLKKVPRRMSSRDRRRALGDAYLEATYGWQPLIGDIQGGLAALRSYRQHRGQFGVHQKIKVVGYDRFESNSVLYRNAGFFAYRSKCHDTVIESCKLSGAVRVMDEGSLSTWQEVTGFRPEDFIPTAWELIPYSFLIDYFTNIGGILDAYSSINGRLVYCSQTTRRLHKREAFCDKDCITWIPTVDTVKSIYVLPSTFAFERKTFTREKISSIIPDFRFKLPSFGSRKALNVATLIHQGNVRRPFF